MRKIAVGGWTDRGYTAVAEAFAANFTMSSELGAAVALFVDGRKVVDLWGGVADPRTGRPWTDATPVVVFSASKGLVATCVADLVDAGRLELGAPVGRYWPEFAQAGKHAVTVRCLLSHRAGLPTVSGRLSYADVLAWDPVVRALAKQLPAWPPGTRHGYHALTFGWLAGELIRRVSGHTPGEYLRRRYAEPLGLDLWMGLPADELHRPARLEDPEPGDGEAPDDGPSAEAMAELARAMTLGGALPAAAADGSNAYNDPRLLTPEIPAANAVTTARDLARFYASAVTPIGPRQPLRSSTISRFVALQAVDPPSAGDRRWGSGFMLDSPGRPMLGPRSFGHDGASGCVAFADDEYRVGFAYVTNRISGPGDERAARLTAAVRQCLGAAPPWSADPEPRGTGGGGTASDRDLELAGLQDTPALRVGER